MRLPRFYEERTDLRPSARRTAVDILLILLLVATMIAIRANAPSNTYSYAQFWQIRASIDQLNGGSMLLPSIDAAGTPARKGQLYAWMLTAAMKLTGANGDFIYRIPTILAACGLAVLIYFLARRWYNRRVGLMAACLWITALHMSKLIYLGTTDMLLAWWIGVCVFCADRLTFHPIRRRRWAWAVAFWGAMILAAITKGWGIVNLAVLGGFLALASGVAPGFTALRRASGAGKVLLALRLLVRRWWATIRAMHLGWGLLGMCAVMLPLWWGMLHVGGEEFRRTVHYEVWQRLTGRGEHAPGGSSVPMVAHLYYNLLPVSVFAGCAFFLVRPRRWLNRRSPIALPLCWIIAVLVAFAIPSGFRPDYLLPCYAAVALMGAWAVEELFKPARYDARGIKHLRRICQGVPFVLAVGLIAVALLYLLHSYLPAPLGRVIHLPPRLGGGVWYVLAVLPVLGIAIFCAGVRAIRRRRLTLVVAGTCAGMLGLLFCNANLFTRGARTGDGDVMVRFAEDIKPFVGADDFMIYAAIKLGPEPYLGRFGRELTSAPSSVITVINGSKERWLITSDIGLLHLGAYRLDANGPVNLELEKDARKRQYRFRTRPQDIGSLRVRSDRPIKFEKWGTIYLIELKRPVTPTSQPFLTGYISDPVR
ncbi:MAG TPA: hypothetical protein ENH84_01865 [Phycisphaerae bacterium]|nr:hypothetical protein [Phycisphaerae bacterium]